MSLSPKYTFISALASEIRFHPLPGLVIDGTGTGKNCLDFDAGVWGFAGADSEAVRGLRLGNCQGKREGED